MLTTYQVIEERERKERGEGEAISHLAEGVFTRSGWGIKTSLAVMLCYFIMDPLRANMQNASRHGRP